MKVWRRALLSTFLCSLVAVCGCDRSGDVELERARAEVAKARAEAEKAKAEAERAKMQAARAGQRSGGTLSETNNINRRELIKRIVRQHGCINANMKTMGGKVWWTEVRARAGWRIQKNKLTGLCRILSPENVRYAWGKDEKVLEIWEAISPHF
jgi:hypothetical protein